MVTPVMDGYGLCVRRYGELAGHDGCNEGFLTYRRFSLKEDICVAAALNNIYGRSYDRLHEAGERIFDVLKG